MPAQKPGRSRQDYCTPPSLLDAIKKEWDIEDFDWDLAASKDNRVCTGYYSKEDDALTKSWKLGNSWNWCNPPFGDIEPWVAKAYTESMTNNANTIVLVPASVGSNWWAKWVHKMCPVIYFMNGRITFVGATDPYPKDTALLFYDAYSPEESETGYYKIWKFVQPKTPKGA